MFEAKASMPEFKRTVLIVEDELINRHILGGIVESVYDVLYAENGREALDLINRYGETLSIVLLDLMMPVMDGYELLRILHSDSQLRRLPVIVLTSEKSAEVESLKLGAVDFITKPYDAPSVILARINRSIELAEDASIIQNASTDELTGLYKKSFFYEYSRKQDIHYPDIPMDAIVLNINRFRLINELNGRRAADGVLAAIGRAILKELDNTNGFACHSESDKFFIYMKHIEDGADMLSRIETYVKEETGFAAVKMYMGIYPDVDKDTDMETRISRAAIACAAAEGNILNPVACYDDRMHDDQVFAGRLIADFESSLENRDFVIYYQPKYSVRDGLPVLSSAEALVRWKHPGFGLLGPGTFIPLFEQNGLVTRLDRYIWKTAAEQVREWREKFGVTIPVSVNVSRIDLFSPDICTVFGDITGEAGIASGDLLLEITESAYAEDSRHIVDTVTKLRTQGFKIEMDDFGTGYSSLNMLATIPFDVLKLDMSFVRNIGVDPHGMRMIELIMDMAKFLGLSVVAEGVETEEQATLLKNAGVDIIQGYYFSKPLPPEDFEKLIQRR